MRSRRPIVMLLVAAAAAISAGSAGAQEDLTRGKTPAQLYASDCAECHRNPRALGNRTSAYSLSSFLRVHYTASRESAAALANYLVALGPDPRAGSGRPSSSSQRARPAGPREERKSSEANKATEQAKPAEETPKPPQPVPEAPASTPAAETPAPAAAPPAAAEPQ